MSFRTSSNDYVKTYSGEAVDSSSLLYPFSGGYVGNPSVKSYGESMYIRMTSNSYGSDDGFDISYQSGMQHQ